MGTLVDGVVAFSLQSLSLVPHLAALDQVKEKRFSSAAWKKDRFIIRM